MQIKGYRDLAAHCCTWDGRSARNLTAMRSGRDSGMVTRTGAVVDRDAEDPVSNLLKWILLAVAVTTFAILGWTTSLTYKAAPPFPDRFVSADGTPLMSAAAIQAGKAGFQKADLMDYGSLYGMGSYFGEDYTAANLVRLATLTNANLAKAKYAKPIADLSVEEQASVKAAMQIELQSIDLTQQVTTVPDAVAAAITTLRGEIGQGLLQHDFAKGWTRAYSLDEQSAAETAEFLIYSSLTTVARRPGTTVSWTQNWPFEPLVGNTPTTSTFRWTWISFCFTFFAFGAVLFIYERYLNGPDQAPMDPVLAHFAPLTASQRRVGKTSS
jgi:nitric oxide reductase subunit B